MSDYFHFQFSSVLAHLTDPSSEKEIDNSIKDSISFYLPYTIKYQVTMAMLSRETFDLPIIKQVEGEREISEINKKDYFKFNFDEKVQFEDYSEPYNECVRMIDDIAIDVNNYRKTTTVSLEPRDTGEEGDDIELKGKIYLEVWDERPEFSFHECVCGQKLIPNVVEFEHFEDRLLPDVNYDEVTKLRITSYEKISDDTLVELENELDKDKYKVKTLAFHFFHKSSREDQIDDILLYKEAINRFLSKGYTVKFYNSFVGFEPADGMVNLLIYLTRGNSEILKLVEMVENMGININEVHIKCNVQISIEQKGQKNGYELCIASYVNWINSNLAYPVKIRMKSAHTKDLIIINLTKNSRAKSARN